MKTAFILLAQYETAIIPIDLVARDYFSHLTPGKFAQKCASGDIPLPVVRIDPGSQKSLRGIALNDLAQWIDTARASARKECEQLTGMKY